MSDVVLGAATITAAAPARRDIEAKQADMPIIRTQSTKMNRVDSSKTQLEYFHVVDLGVVWLPANLTY